MWPFSHKKKNVIFDGDMGGDDMWAIALLLAHRKRFDVLGISTVFGNVSLPQATKVTLGFLEWMNVKDIDVAQGCAIARDNVSPLGDNAFGEDGVGGVIFPKTEMKAKDGDIADWYMEKLGGAKKPVTIIATGPLTNIATLLEKYPDAKNNIAEVIWMGGADHPPGAKGKPVFEGKKERRGNITLNAEFNAYIDPKAVNEVIRSGVNLTIMSADATQHMVLTPRRKSKITALHETYGPDLVKMMTVVEELDRSKFGVKGPFIHDPNAVAYFLKPKLYKKLTSVGISFDEAAPDFNGTRGMANLSGEGHVTWVNGVKDKSGVFKTIRKGLQNMVHDALGLYHDA
jgi:purine nucleosidase